MQGIMAPIVQAVQTALGPEADRLGRETGFVRRQVKLTGSTFAQTLVLGFLAHPEASYSELNQTAAVLGVEISPQGLEQRFTPAAALLMQRLLQLAVAQVLDVKHQTAGLLKPFCGVFIRDSSTIALPEGLQEVWRGVGGSRGETAALKLQVNLDYRTGQVHGPLLQDGRTQDQESPYQQAQLPAGALHLADLGYFNLERLATDQANGVYWITRLKTAIKLYDPAGQELDLLGWLQSQVATGVAETAVQVGARQRIPCRLVAQRVSEDVAAERCRRLSEWARKKQCPVSEHRRRLTHWTLLLTNVGVDLLSAQQVLTLQRVRWQVELLFRLWKSQAKVDEWRSSKQPRILCEIYAKLLGLVITHWIMAVSLWHRLDRSLPQATSTVQKFAFSIALAITNADSLYTVLSKLGTCLAAGCRQQRRKTHPATFQLLETLP